MGGEERGMGSLERVMGGLKGMVGYVGGWVASRVVNVITNPRNYA
jgi:hypothetical protein